MKFLLKLSLSVLFVLFQYSSSVNIDDNNQIAALECPAVNPEEDVLLPGEDCQHFYKCNDGIPVLQSCPPGLEWCDELKRCEYPEIANCKLSSTTAKVSTTKHHRPTTRPPKPTRPTRPPRPTTRPPRPTTRPPRPTTRPPRPTTTPPRPTTSVPPTCPLENPEDDLLFPAETCTHYYICDRGELVLQECPSGLHWSIKENRCEYPETAGCDRDDNFHHRPTTRPPRPTRTTRPPRPTRTTRPPRPTRTTRPPRPTRPTRPTTRPPRPTTKPPSTTTTAVPPKPICPLENPEDDLLFPAETCEHYYICDHGELVKQECPSGLHWSVEENRCEYPETAGCNP